MFDIGFWEIALIAMLALVVLGPKRLPEAARAAGYWLGRVRQFIANAKNDLDQEIQGGGLKELRRLKEELDETRRYIRQVAGNAKSEFTDAIDDIKSFPENSIGGGSDSKKTLLSNRKKKTSKNKKTGKKSAAKKLPGKKKKNAKKKTAGKKSAAKKSTRKKTSGKRVSGKKTAGKKTR